MDYLKEPGQASERKSFGVYSSLGFDFCKEEAKPLRLRTEMFDYGHNCLSHTFDQITTMNEQQEVDFTCIFPSSELRINIKHLPTQVSLEGK